MKKSKLILLFLLAMLISVAGNAKAQDGSEYLLWEKTKDFTTRSVAFNMEETQLAVLGEYNYNADTSVIKILSVQNNGEELFSITTKSQSWHCFYSTDGKYLVVYGMEETQIYDAETYKPVKTLTQCNLSFSVDNILLARGKKGPSFEILNNGTYEKVFEKSYTPAQSNQICSIDVFFTPNGKYLIVNLEYAWQDPYSGNETIQEIFDAKTFQKVDRTINCLKGVPNFSNNGLVAKSFGYLDDKNIRRSGFRIYDYDKDSLIWEQETGNTGMLRFLSTKNYLFSCYQPGFGWKLDFWDLDKKAIKKEYDGYKHKLYFDYGSKISKNDNYLVHGGGIYAPIRVYNFGKFLDEAVSVSMPNQQEGIAIHPNPSKNSITIYIKNVYTSKMELKLMDATGKIVANVFSGIPASNVIEFYTANLSKGIYFIRLESEQDSITKKIIIE